jgi:hypothetical protein
MARVTTADPPVRVWRMNCCDYVAARTLTTAIDCLREFSGASREEMLADDPQPLTDAEMARQTFVTEEEAHIKDYSGPPIYKRHAFAVELQRLIDAGATFPRFFASTEI